MASRKKAEHTGETTKGKAKEATGRAIGNERLVAEGKAEQIKGDAKQTGRKAKDTFGH